MKVHQRNIGLARDQSHCVDMPEIRQSGSLNLNVASLIERECFGSEPEEKRERENPTVSVTLE